MLALFELQRLALLAFYPSDFAAGAPAWTVASAFLHGLRLDEIVAGYAVLPAALLSLLLAALGAQPDAAGRWVRRLLTGLFLAAALAAWGELEYFGYFRDRYSFLAVEYLDTPGVVWAQIWARYHPIPVACAAGLSAWAFAAGLKRLAGRPPSRCPRAGSTAAVAASLLALALFIRGVGLVPTRWGAAYFSSLEGPNRLALNGLLTLATDVEYRLKDKFWTFFDGTLPEAVAVARARRLIARDAAAPPDGAPLRRSVVPPGPLVSLARPNIALVAMESFSPQVAGALGGPIPSTPRFDELARRGVLFSRYFSQGARTGRAIFSLVSGVPSPPGQSAMKMSGKREYPSLVRALKALGYRTAFVYGGDLNFDNMDAFLRQEGFDELVGIDDFSGGRVWQLKTKWGVPDEFVLSKAAELAARPGAPNFVMVMTLSNHPPYVLPSDAPRPFSGRLADERNAAAYADRSLGGFVDRLRSLGAADKTLLVAMGDHSMFYDGLPGSELSHFHVPCLFYGPGVLKVPPGTIDRPAGHTDIAPTLLGLLGRPYEEAFWGRDLFHDPDGTTPLLLASTRAMWLVEGGRAVRDEPYAPAQIFDWTRPEALPAPRAAGSDDPLLLDERALSLTLRVVAGERGAVAREMAP